MSSQVEKALAIKEKGNTAFAQRAYRYAIELYTEAIELDPNNHSLFSNRSASYSLIDSFSRALEDSERCIILKPDFSKGYFRKGVALKGLKLFKEAYDAFSEGLKKDPDNKELKKSLEEVSQLLCISSDSASVKPPFEDLPVELILDCKEECSLETTPEGPRVTYLSRGRAFHSTFLSRIIGENEIGVFRWTIKIKYSDTNTFLEIGGAPPNKCLSLIDNFLGSTSKDKKSDGSFALYIRKEQESLSSVLRGVEGEADIPPKETPVPDDSLVSVEVDTIARTMSFFIGETKVPRAVSGIPLPLKLGTTGLARPSYTSISFRRLSLPTPSNVVCTFYKCKK